MSLRKIINELEIKIKAQEQSINVAIAIAHKAESENERLVNERDLYKKQFNELKLRFFDLKKENADYKDTNNILRTRIDKSKELSNRNGELLLKQFAERLKKILYNFQTWEVPYGNVVSGEIDEILKEFLK